MTLSEELTWRGFVNQTTYKNPDQLDGESIDFYFGVDPSSDSMTIGNLASAMMIRHFIAHGHRAYLLVGGATGMIGDPDGKSSERKLQTLETIAHNKQAIAAQYRVVFAGQDFEIVDNYDWFKDYGYLNFLRDIGKHVPMRQMLARDFVQSRLGESGDGISYAEFSYSLIQGYDFVYLNKEKNVTLQLCGADQWGNSIAGVDLIRRINGNEAHVWSCPLIINKATGVKFGKSEDGAIWLDPTKTTPTAFYQFWINCDDLGAEDYLKVYTMLSQAEIKDIMVAHAKEPKARLAQKRLAEEVTKLVHGEHNMNQAKEVTDYLTGSRSIAEADNEILDTIRQELPNLKADVDQSIVAALVQSGLAQSNGQARKFIEDGAVSVNGAVLKRQNFEPSDFLSGRLLLRRGKAFKDSALVEL
jgi:tyrosyl-tRNA synthetase